MSIHITDVILALNSFQEENQYTFDSHSKSYKSSVGKNEQVRIIVEKDRIFVEKKISTIFQKIAAFFSNRLHGRTKNIDALLNRIIPILKKNLQETLEEQLKESLTKKEYAELKQQRVKADGSKISLNKRTRESLFEYQELLADTKMALLALQSKSKKPNTELQTAIGTIRRYQCLVDNLLGE